MDLAVGVVVIFIVVVIIFIYLIIDNKQSQIIWFYSTGCGHCIKMEPAWKEFESMVGNKVSTEKINIAENPKLANEYNVSGVPYIIKKTGDSHIVYTGDRSAISLYNFSML